MTRRLTTVLLRLFPLRLVERVPSKAIQRDIDERKFFLAGIRPVKESL